MFYAAYVSMHIEVELYVGLLKFCVASETYISYGTLCASRPSGSHTGAGCIGETLLQVVYDACQNVGQILWA